MSKKTKTKPEQAKEVTVESAKAPELSERDFMEGPPVEIVKAETEFEPQETSKETLINRINGLAGISAKSKLAIAEIIRSAEIE